MPITSTLRRARTLTATAFAGFALLAASSTQAQTAPAAPAPRPVAPAASPAVPAPSVRSASSLPSPVAVPVAPRPGTTPSRPAATGNANRGASAEEVFAAWDKDHSGNLSMAEFRNGWDQVKTAALVARLGNLFRATDANRNGKLEAAEYASLPLIKRGGAEAPPLSAFDANKDGALDNAEYMKMVEVLVRTADAQGGK